MFGKILRVLKSMHILLFWSLVLLPSGLGCISSDLIRDAGFAPGTYEGTGQGRRGLIRVRLQISPAGIEDIVILSHRDSAYPGVAAMEELLDEILETGFTDLDAISGATLSSAGFLEAVDDALRKASALK